MIQERWWEVRDTRWHVLYFTNFQDAVAALESGDRLYCVTVLDTGRVISWPMN